MNEALAWYILIAVILIGAVVTHPKKPENYTQPGKLPLVGFWNVFDPTRFTEEGIAYHRRTLWWTGVWGVVAVVGGILIQGLLPVRSPIITGSGSGGHLNGSDTT